MEMDVWTKLSSSWMFGWMNFVGWNWILSNEYIELDWLTCRFTWTGRSEWVDLDGKNCVG